MLQACTIGQSDKTEQMSESPKRKPGLPAVRDSDDAVNAVIEAARELGLPLDAEDARALLAGGEGHLGPPPAGTGPAALPRPRSASATELMARRHAITRGSAGVRRYEGTPPFDRVREAFAGQRSQIDHLTHLHATEPEEGSRERSDAVAWRRPAIRLVEHDPAGRKDAPAGPAKAEPKDQPRPRQAFLEDHHESAAVADVPPHVDDRMPPPLDDRPRPGAHITLPLKALRDQGYVDTRGQRTTINEEMRRIKRPLLQRAFAEGAGPSERVIMVTSARAGEGKTFTALNLALSLHAERHVHVLLIDAHAARDGLSARLGVGDRPGLANLLAGTHDNPLLGTDLGDVWLLPSGTVDPHMTELIASQPMVDKLEQWLASMPNLIIIIDSPAVTHSSEAGVLALLAGQVILVVEAGRTPHGAIEQALARLGDVQPCVVVNKMPNEAAPGARNEPEAPAAATSGPAASTRSADGPASDACAQPARRSLFARLFRRPVAIALAIAGTGLGVPAALAAWVITPAIEAGGALNDNLTLENDEDREAGYVAFVSPGLFVDGSTGRLDLTADYLAEAYFFRGDASDEDLRHNFDGLARLEMVQDHLFLDARGFATPRLRDSRSSSVFSEFNLTDERVQSYGYDLQPAVVGTWRDQAIAGARVAFGETFFDVDDIQESQSLLGEVFVQNGPAFDRLDWRLSAFAAQTDFQDSSVSRGRTVERWLTAVDVGYGITDELRLTAGVGYSYLEDPDSVQEVREGPYLAAGLDWRPSDRLTLTTRAGTIYDRFFTQNRLRYEISEKVSASIGYAERIEDRETLRFAATSPEDGSAATTSPDTGLIEDGVTDSETFVLRRADLDVVRDFGRNTLALYGFFDRREYESSRPDDRGYGVGVRFSRDLRRNLELTSDLRLQRFEIDDDISDTNLYRFAVRLEHFLNPTASIALGYSFGKRDASNREQDATENVVALRFRKEF